MIERFFARLIAGISEELLNDLFKAIIKEIVLKRKKADLSQAMVEFKSVINQLAAEEMTDVEKNKMLIDAGRTVIKRVRK